MCGQAGAINRRLRGGQPCAAPFWATVLLCAILCNGRPSFAVTPESPEVKKLVDSGLQFLSEKGDTEPRLGGKCLIALAFLKAERRDSPQIEKAVYACREAMQAAGDDVNLDVYSNGL